MEAESKELLRKFNDQTNHIEQLNIGFEKTLSHYQSSMELLSNQLEMKDADISDLQQQVQQKQDIITRLRVDQQTAAIDEEKKQLDDSIRDLEQDQMKAIDQSLDEAQFFDRSMESMSRRGTLLDYPEPSEDDIGLHQDETDIRRQESTRGQPKQKMLFTDLPPLAIQIEKGIQTDQ